MKTLTNCVYYSIDYSLARSRRIWSISHQDTVNDHFLKHCICANKSSGYLQNKPLADMDTKQYQRSLFRQRFRFFLLIHHSIIILSSIQLAFNLCYYILFNYIITCIEIRFGWQYRWHKAFLSPTLQPSWRSCCEVSFLRHNSLVVKP